MTTRELLSALADDQLNEEEFAAALDACGHDESALACWSTYHLIGDALRSPVAAPGAGTGQGELAFLGRLGQRLAQEPRHTAPPALVPTPVASPLRPTPERLHHHRGPASNDGNFRWKLVAGVASLAAMSAIAWNASGLLAPAAAPELAQASAPQVVVTSAQGPVVRDARLEELLAAHRQFGTASALQESSSFLRNATFDAPREAPAASGR